MVSLSCTRIMKSKSPIHRKEECNESMMFPVKYLGQGELQKPGLEDMCTFVKSMYRRVKNSKGKDVVEGKFILSHENCSLKLNAQHSVDSTLQFRTRRIQFSGVYELNPKIFFFTYQFGKTADVLQCHVLKCRNKKEAKCLAKQAGELFKEIAFSFNRRLKNTPNYRPELSSVGSRTSTMSTGE